MALIFYLTHVHLGFGTLGELGSECARVLGVSPGDEIWWIDR